MKKNRFIFSLTLILFSYVSQAQLIMIDSETGEYNYEEIVNVAGISQQQIYNRAKEWLNIYYQSTDSISTDSLNLNRIVSNEFVFKFIKKDIDMKIFFNIEIKSKTNKYKYEFSNFEVGKKIRDQIDAMDLSVYINRFPEQYQILIEEPIDSEIMNAISSLAYYILNGKLNDEDDDW